MSPSELAYSTQVENLVHTFWGGWGGGAGGLDFFFCFYLASKRAEERKDRNPDVSTG